MKKFLFSALACVAFAGSSFASNEVINDTKYVSTTVEKADDKPDFNKSCKIAVKVKDRFGNGSTQYAGGSGNISLADCDNVRSRFEEDLRAKGYTFNSETDVTLIWGPQED